MRGAAISSGVQSLDEFKPMTPSQASVRAGLGERLIQLLERDDAKDPADRPDALRTFALEHGKQPMADLIQSWLARQAAQAVLIEMSGPSP